MLNRRSLVRQFAAYAAASPLFAFDDDDIKGPVNVHEFEEVAKRKLNKLAYDFIAGGVEDEITLRANRAAYEQFFIVPRVMNDVSNVTTNVEVFGLKLESPVIIAPTGGKNLVLPGADEVVAEAALSRKTLITSATGTQKILSAGKPLMWWSNTIGAPNKAAARSYARRIEEGGGKGITVTVDNQYQSNRDRNNRNRFDYGYMQTGVPKPGETRKPVSPAEAAKWMPHTPSMTWEMIDWLKSGTSLPIILKGILNADDAQLAVKNGADGIIVSNHGGRQLDGVIATLDALPDVVDAVAGKVPVLMDGGIRRGIDILKALSLGAKAVLIGRPPLWGLAAFGQPGVERVLELLQMELRLAIALAGKRSPAELDRGMLRKLRA